MAPLRHFWSVPNFSSFKKRPKWEWKKVSEKILTRSDGNSSYSSLRMRTMPVYCYSSRIQYVKAISTLDNAHLNMFPSKLNRKTQTQHCSLLILNYKGHTRHLIWCRSPLPLWKGWEQSGLALEGTSGISSRLCSLGGRNNDIFSSQFARKADRDRCCTVAVYHIKQTENYICSSKARLIIVLYFLKHLGQEGKMIRQ